MRLHILFIVIDLVILLAYPVVFLINALRQLLQNRR
jgi:hypothetical protein